MERRTDYAQLTDDQLVRALADGDPGGLTVLSERHARPVYSLALRILGDPGWAEEVAQDVLLRLWTAPQMYNPARGDLRPWLLSVTHHAAIDGLRGRRGTARARNSGPALLDDMAQEGDGPEELAWSHLQSEGIWQALSNLPDAQREVVELVYYGGLSQSEVAAQTGQPLGTVKTRVRLGLQKLKVALERYNLTE